MSKRGIFFLGTVAVVGLCYYFVMQFFGESLHDFFIVSGVKNAVTVLDLFQYNPAIGYCGGLGQDILVAGAGVIRVESGCDGLDLLAVFAVFAMAFPGKWVNKLWYIPLGLLLVYLFNVLRIAFLVMLKAEFGHSIMEFNHKYTFIVLVYGFVFLLWYLWIKKFAIPHARTQVA